jgi:hypothetical protein
VGESAEMYRSMDFFLLPRSHRRDAGFYLNER